MYLYDISGPNPVPITSTRTDDVTRLVFNPAGDRLLAAGKPFSDTGRGLLLFDVPSLNPIASRDGETVDAMPTAAAFSPDGRTVAAAAYGGRVRLFDAATLTERPESAAIDLLATDDIAVSPDCRWLAERRTGGGMYFLDRPPPRGELRVWDLSDTVAPPRVRVLRENEYGELRFGSDGRTVGLAGLGAFKDADGKEHPPTPAVVFAVPDLTPSEVKEWQTQPHPVRWQDGGRATEPGLPFRMWEKIDGRTSVLRVETGDGPTRTVTVPHPDQWWPLPDGCGVVTLTAGVARVVAVR